MRVETLKGKKILGILEDDFGDIFIAVEGSLVLTLSRIYPYPSTQAGVTVSLKPNPDLFDRILKMDNIEEQTDVETTSTQDL